MRPNDLLVLPHEYAFHHADGHSLLTLVKGVVSPGRPSHHLAQVARECGGDVIAHVKGDLGRIEDGMRLRLHARSGSVELVSPDERLAMPRRATLRSSTVATLLLCLGAGACAKTDAEWVAQLADPDPFARALAVIALAEQAPELADTALEVALETVDRAELGLAIPAAIALAKFAPHAADSLVDMFVEDELKTLHWKQAVLGALVSAGPGAVPAILGAVRGPGRARANELGMVLIQAGPRSVAPLVDVLERDPDPALKSYAAWVLGQIGPAARAAMPALEGAMVGAAPELQADLRAALARVRGTPP